MAKDNIIESIKKYVRAADYLSVGQIFLANNFLLEKELTFDDIKPRLLGHWGTCPGINFIYANLNYLIKKHNVEILFVLGPGHGFAALQANLFIEGTLNKYYPEASHTEDGIGFLMKNFSWPYGFPSHSNPATPGVILEGGELGYSLSTSYGAVLDNPELITVCVVGDGEAETGPIAAAWHLNKFLNPKRDGVVLPILHVNGYKISGPTIFGRMSNKELKSLFFGYGYKPYIVEGKNDMIYKKMIDILEACYKSIKNIQNQARQGKNIIAPKWPMIILKTLKGWGGIKKLGDKKIEGNCASHQVVLNNAKTDKTELKALQKWLLSYKFGELFNKKSGFIAEIKDLIPKDGFKIGENKYSFGGKIAKDLVLPSVEKFSEDATVPGTIGSSSMRRAGLFLNEVFKLNKDNFRLMSPDETYSNKLDAVFETTKRVFEWPIKNWDKDLAPEGRVMEILSEHSLQGLMQGYVLTGRHAVFASYEAFIQIISSMVDQYAKFLRISREIPWRGKIPSLNYILTSSGWRQEHNGFSHQNPGFLDNVVQKHNNFIKIYFPPDGNSTLVVLKKCLSSRNFINIIVAGKTQEPRWLTPDLAQKELEKGLMIWDFASDENPDIVIAAIGDYLTKEALAAIDIVKTETPEIKIRFVNIMELPMFSNENNFSDEFEKYFTKDKPVIFNFHGYPETFKKILFDYSGNITRFLVHGYIENGSTTTPFDMQVRNKTSRYHLAKEIFEKMSGKILAFDKTKKLIEKYNFKLAEHQKYIKKYGIDPEEIELWQWKKFW